MVEGELRTLLKKSKNSAPVAGTSQSIANNSGDNTTVFLCDICGCFKSKSHKARHEDSCYSKCDVVN